MPCTARVLLADEEGCTNDISYRKDYTQLTPQELSYINWTSGGRDRFPFNSVVMVLIGVKFFLCSSY